MRRMLSIFFCLLASSPLYAQSVVIDFASKKLVESPPKINKKTNVTIEVQNVNDVLYQYKIVLTQTPRDHDDFATIAGAFKDASRSGEAALDQDCPKLLQDVEAKTTALGAEQDKFYALPETQTKSCSATKPCSVDIVTTQGVWTDKVQPAIDAVKKSLDNLEAIQACENRYGKQITDLKSALADLGTTREKLFAATHQVEEQKVLLPDTDDTVDVTEFYFKKGATQGTATVADTVSVKFSPANDRLTLSAGALFSMIQNRGYTSQAAPNGTGTQNVLAVSGMSTLSPLALALLNYELPPIHGKALSTDDWGLAISTGPALRFGSKSDTSSFGYFVGLGLHIYHRFYISPGVHIGEFADYPPGFTAPNQVVPSGLGTPTPVKRYIARFAFGITYKTHDFSSLGLSTSATKAPSENKTTQTAPDSTKKTQSTDKDKNGNGTNDKPAPDSNPAPTASVKPAPSS